METTRIPKIVRLAALVLAILNLWGPASADAVERFTQGNCSSRQVGGSDLSAGQEFLVFEEYESSRWSAIFVEIATGNRETMSIATDGTAANANSTDPQVSDDGQYVAFESEAYNLDSGDTWVCSSRSCRDIFIRDRVAGTTTRINLSSAGEQAHQDSDLQDMSPDGNLVLFTSTANNLVDGDTNNTTDVFLRNWKAGTTVRLSVSRTGAQGNSSSTSAFFFGNGRYAAFYTNATNLSPNGERNTWLVRDLQTGQLDDFFDGESYLQVSADARFLTFSTTQSHVVEDTNGARDVYRYDRDNDSYELLSLGITGEIGNADSGGRAVRISGNGKLVFFDSYASNLVQGDFNNNRDLFVRDLESSDLRKIPGLESAYDLRPSDSGSQLIFSSGRSMGLSDCRDIDTQSESYRDIFRTESPLPEPICGNGTLEFGEACDDGGTIDGDCCDASCQFESPGQQQCGVGACLVITDICTNGMAQVCEPGEPDLEGPAGDPTCSNAIDDDCDETADSFDPSCAATGCGNGLIDVGEDCDDTNTEDGDCCSSTCQAEPAGSQTCGEGACLNTVDACNAGETVDCTPLPAPEATETSCGNGEDDDCDGLVDGDDSDCAGAPTPTPVAPTPTPGTPTTPGTPGVTPSPTPAPTPGPTAIPVLLGGGPAKNDCMMGFSLAAASRAPGRTSWVCEDGDPDCDVGTLAGQCVFEARICLNQASDQCSGTAVDGIQLRRPDPSRPKNSGDAANAAAFTAAIESLGARNAGQCRRGNKGALCETHAECDTFPGAGNGFCNSGVLVFEPALTTAGCSDPFEITVPLKGGKGRGRKNLTLRAIEEKALGAGISIDQDRLRFICLPPSS